MQIVGRECGGCRKPINMNRWVVGCRDCQEVFHSKCIEESDVCPECEGVLLEGAELEAFELDNEEIEHKEHDLEAHRVFKRTASILSAATVLAVIGLDGALDLDPPATTGPMLGLPFVIGAYFIVCSIWFRDFVFYRWKVARALAIFGEPMTYYLYLVLGLFAVAGGSLILLASVG